MRTRILIYSLCLMALLAGCARQPESKPPVDLAREEAALRATDAQWLAAVKSRDADKAASYWADDATLFPPGSAPIHGKAAIRAYVAGAFSSPDFSIVWETETLQLSASGDMAYQVAVDRITARGPHNKLVTDKAHGVVVWKKQADGSWKAAIDIWTTEPPPARH